MALLSVADALAQILAGGTPVPMETVELMKATGRVLAEEVISKRTQPPFNVSAMDGFAIRAIDLPGLPTSLKLVGQSAAGHGFAGSIGAGESVRIFTGAPIPEGADAIIIQENTRHDATSVTILEGQPDPEHMRLKGSDFAINQRLVEPGRHLTSRDVTLAAAGGHATLKVHRKPRVAILATGDELVLPGEPVGPDQIICSNPFGLAAIVEGAGGDPEFLGIARDDRAHLAEMCAQARGADILITIGGASVGDHDLVGPVLQDMGLDLGFWKIAMRPGKPLMSGRLEHLHVLGLPGNPVSSLICARIFLVPLIELLGGGAISSDQTTVARTTVPLSANGPRQHYMRATKETDAAGIVEVTPVPSQDSALLAHLAMANCLIVRPPADAAKAAGDAIEILPLDF